MANIWLYRPKAEASKVIAFANIFGVFLHPKRYSLSNNEKYCHTAFGHDESAARGLLIVS